MTAVLHIVADAKDKREVPCKYAQQLYVKCAILYITEIPSEAQTSGVSEVHR